MGTEQARAGELPSILSGKLHHPPRAKRVVQLFMAGAASHLDLFDFKPELVKRHGQPSDFGEAVEAFQNGLGPWKKPVWDFQSHGQSGKMLGEVVADLGSVVDEIAWIHNLVGKTGVHSQGTLLQSTGFNRPGFPSAGSWVSYGLGSMNNNLPAYVVLPDHRGLASNGTKWRCLRQLPPWAHSILKCVLGVVANKPAASLNHTKDMILLCLVALKS
jgi:hypothetical protein